MKRGLLEGVLPLAVVGLLAWALLAQAQATREAATAARVAATGQAVTSGGLVLVLVVGVLLGVLGVLLGLGLWFRGTRQSQAQGRPFDYAQGRPFDCAQGRQWVAGPNAQWGRVEQRSPASVDALVQLEVLRTLREIRGPEPEAEQRALPGEVEQGGGDVWEAW
jgi:hypothetical protein